ncbi:hypothetical protein N7495_002654 [Penicillium taxi]|uniref:uncharacterized protein n=1 Tax=Penicillium taxi TaxID=168475 RepID=UPI00254582C8|nr:uncharacterized protein N7495_002654 [Penicillium taxi]KAJ5902126.1 hypothetical protein N7495_002654 [Penicillium taxi]
MVLLVRRNDYVTLRHAINSLIYLNAVLRESKNPVKIFISSLPDKEIRNKLEKVSSVSISASYKRTKFTNISIRCRQAIDQLPAHQRCSDKHELPALAEKIREQSLLSLRNDLLTIDSQLKVWPFALLYAHEYVEIKMQYLTAGSSLCSYFEEIDQIYGVKPADRVYYVAAGIDELCLDTCDFNQGNPLAWEEFFSEISPGGLSIFAMRHFLFVGILLDWWEDAPGRVNDRGPNLLTLAARARSGKMAPSLAAVSQRIETARYLVQEAHADVSQSYNLEELREDYEESITMLLSLVIAAKIKDKELLQILVHAGANVRVPDQFRNFLAVAIRFRNTKGAEHLIQKAGADVDLLVKGATAVFKYNARGSNFKTVKYLVGASANIHKKFEKDGLVTLAVSKNTSNLSISSLTLEQRSTCKSSSWQLSTISSLIVSDTWYKRRQFLSEARYGCVLEKAAVEDKICKLLKAASFLGGYTESVKLLISHGIDVNLSLQHGNYGSALTAAGASDYKIGAFKFLVEAGANLNLSLQGGNFDSGLAAAASQRDVEHKSVYWKRGGRLGPATENRDFGSTLALASACTSIDIMNCLLEAGAEVNPTQSRDISSGGRSAFDTLTHEMIHDKEPVTCTSCRCRPIDLDVHRNLDSHIPSFSRWDCEPRS